MNQRNVPSLSAIMAFRAARRGGLLGLSAVSLHRLLLVIPALCALAYPSLLSWLSAGLVLVHGSDSPDGVIVWIGVIAVVAIPIPRPKAGAEKKIFPLTPRRAEFNRSRRSRGMGPIGSPTGSGWFV